MKIDKLGNYGVVYCPRYITASPLCVVDRPRHISISMWLLTHRKLVYVGYLLGQVSMYNEHAAVVISYIENWPRSYLYLGQFSMCEDL